MRSRATVVRGPRRAPRYAEVRPTAPGRLRGAVARRTDFRRRTAAVPRVRGVRRNPAKIVVPIIGIQSSPVRRPPGSRGAGVAYTPETRVSRTDWVCAPTFQTARFSKVDNSSTAGSIATRPRCDLVVRPKTYRIPESRGRERVFKVFFSPHRHAPTRARGTATLRRDAATRADGGTLARRVGHHASVPGRPAVKPDIL